MKLIKLQTLYDQYLEQYKLTKERNHPHPSELLALLLLQDKDEYSVDKIPIGSFYKVYKTPIDAKIAKVISDFELTEDEIKSYAIGLDTRLKVSDEQIKIKYVFFYGYDALNAGLCRNPNESPERMYNYYLRYWGKKPIPDEQIEEEQPEQGRGKYLARIPQGGSTGT